MEAIEPKGFLEIILEDDISSGRFVQLDVPEIKVIEITGQNIPEKFRQICEDITKPEIIHYIRIYDLSLAQEQILALFKVIAEVGLPYLSFSPKRPGRILDRLYDNEKYDFNLSEFNFRKRPLMSQ